MDPIAKSQTEPERDSESNPLSRRTEGAGAGPTRRRSRTGRGGALKVFQLLPYFLGASLFLSGFLAFLSPFPFLYLLYFSAQPRGSAHPRVGKAFWGAVLTNAALVFLASGTGESVLVFLWLAFLPALVLPILLERFRSVDRSVLGLAVLLAGSIAGVWLGASAFSGMSPLASLDQTVGVALRHWVDALSPEAREAVLGDLEYSAWKQTIFRELPSALGIFCLILAVLNTVTLIRWNPGGLQKHLRLKGDFTRRWRTPDWLVWPSILALAANLLGGGVPGLVGENAVRLLMAVYFFQGLSILAFVLDLWGIRSWFRLLAYGFVFVTMLPLVIALGFFDTWFDFRKKLRQT